MEPITDQVTGLQTGTPQADVITGRVIDRSIETSTVDSGVLNATINSLKGEDRISGFAELASTVSGAAIDATGISQSNIDGGLDADNVFSRGVGVGARSESTGEFQDPVLGRGILRSSVKGGNGRDQLNFIGVASEGLTLTATGVESSSIDGGGGTDSVFAVANAFGIDTSGTGTVTSTGSVNGVIRGGGQNDLIVIQSTANAANPGDGFEARGVAIATSADSSFVSGDGGDDTITVTASAGGNTQQDGSGAVRAEIQGIVNSEFRGGSGNDRISINTSVLQSSPSGNIASATFNIGLAENSVAAGDGGNDEIVIDVSSDSETSNSFGVRQARVKGGDGTDEIVIAARTNNFTGTVYGVSDAEVDGGNDDDTITITADWNGAVFVNGASADRSTVRGGAGNDTLLFELSAATGNKDRTLAALRDSEVYGNSGDDIITVRTEGVVDYDLIDAQLFGGAGNDLFNVGIGTGTISGGAGADVANLDYLDTQPATVETITNGVRVSGTQTRLGAEGTWTQDILGVESYTVNGVVYDSASLAEAF